MSIPTDTETIFVTGVFKTCYFLPDLRYYKDCFEIYTHKVIRKWDPHPKP